MRLYVGQHSKNAAQKSGIDIGVLFHICSEQTSLRQQNSTQNWAGNFYVALHKKICSIIRQDEQKLLSCLILC
jgi:hypothetical protein